MADAMQTQLANNQLERRRVLQQFYVDVMGATPEDVEQAWAVLRMNGCDCYRHDITNLLTGGTASRIVGFITEPL